jgi:hypothetical protein
MQATLALFFCKKSKKDKNPPLFVQKAAGVYNGEKFSDKADDALLRFL